MLQKWGAVHNSSIWTWTTTNVTAPIGNSLVLSDSDNILILLTTDVTQKGNSHITSTMHENTRATTPELFFFFAFIFVHVHDCLCKIELS